MNPSEYNLLKKKRTDLLKKIRLCKNNPSKSSAYKGMLETIDRCITEAEADANISRYLFLLNKKTTLSKAVSVGKYYNKDVSEKEKELQYVLSTLSKIENEDLTQNNTRNTSDSNLKGCNDHSYYIINLGWSNDEENQIVNCIRDFLNRSQYHKTEKTTDASRKENIMSWHYPFDTLEEQTVVKTLRMATTHMLDVLKSWYPETTDAEIFGKISKIYNT